MPSATPAESRIVKTFRSGLIEVLMGANRYQVRAEQGNFSLNIPGTSLAVYPDRGRLVDPDDPTDEPLLAEDQDQPMTGSFTAYLRDLNGDDYITLADFVTHSGTVLRRWGTELKRSGPDSPRVATIQWWFKGNRVGDPKNKGLRCRFSHITGSVAEGSPNLITCNFTSYLPYPEPARWEV